MRCAAYPCKMAEQRDGDTEIRVGDTYYTWARKYGRSGTVYYQHEQCGRPKRSQLSSRKTVAIEDAIDGISLSNWSPELDDDGTYSGGYEDVKSMLEEVASVARDVGQEYQDSYDNMPEGLNQGETAMAMEEVAQELDSWADELESFEPSADEPDLPEHEEPEAEDFEDAQEWLKAREEAEEKWLEACQEALDNWAADVISEAEDLLGNMPEYQG
jgi:hypothetical protein